MSWSVAVWYEKSGGLMQETQGVVPTKWIDKEEKLLWWPTGQLIRKKSHDFPDRDTWRSYTYIKTRLTSDEEDVCSEYAEKKSSSSSSDSEALRSPSQPVEFTKTIKLPSTPRFSVNEVRKRNETPIGKNSRASLKRRQDDDDDMSIKLARLRRDQEDDFDDEHRSDDETLTTKNRRDGAEHIKGKFPMEQGRFQKQVLNLLAQICDRLQTLKENTVEPPAATSQVDSRVVQLKTVDELEAFEIELEKKEKFASLVRQLKRVGGGSVIENTRNVLEKVMTYRLMSHFNMAGKKRKDRDAKISFKDKLLCEAVIASVLVQHTKRLKQKSEKRRELPELPVD